MRKLSLKSIAAIVIVVLTLFLFVRFLMTHPEYVDNLLSTSPWVIVALVAVNIINVGVLALVYRYTVRIAGHSMPEKENLLLTIYSTIANFFGPLQSGPGVRAAYLKTKHHVSLKAYTLATLLYYAFYAVISATMLLIATRPWWQTVLGIVLASGASYAVITLLNRRYASSARQLNLSRRLLVLLFATTLIQLLLVGLRYFIELRSIDPAITPGQALSYTGAANFSLFVSITPDGIGIKEAFLLASQNIHGIAKETIVAASLLDRATYIFTLFLLFLFTLAIHAKDKLKLTKSQPADESDESVQQ